MAKISILTETDLRGIIRLDMDVVNCVEQALIALATGTVEMPPIMRLDIPAHRGEVDIKTAYMPHLASFAIKVSPGFFNNPALGLPSTNGLMMLLSAHTGLVEALLLDNGYLTDVRTAAAGAVAARYLARSEAQVAAILGAGMQAHMQLHALTLVRPITEARIWARDQEKAASVARELTLELGFPVVALADPQTACRGADIIVTTTPADKPILQAAWLEPGQHLTAMGSDAEHKNEIDPSVVRLAAPYVADSLKQTRRLGELHHAIKAGIVEADTPFAELGAVIAGRAAGRQSAEAITFCDLTGTGVQDTAIATLARQRALDAGIGRSIETTKASGDPA